MLKTATKLCAPVIYRVPVDQSAHKDDRLGHQKASGINLQSSELPDIIQKCGGGDFRGAVGKQLLLGPDGDTWFGLFEIKSCVRRASTAEGTQQGARFFESLPLPRWLLRVSGLCPSQHVDHSDYWVDVVRLGSWENPSQPEAALVLELLVRENNMRVEYFQNHITQVHMAWQHLHQQSLIFEESKARLENRQEAYRRALESEQTTRMAIGLTKAALSFLPGVGILSEGSSQLLTGVTGIVDGCLCADQLQALGGVCDILNSDFLADAIKDDLKKMRMSQKTIERRVVQFRSSVNTTQALADAVAQWTETTAELQKSASRQFGRTCEERDVIDSHMELQECLGRMHTQAAVYEKAVAELKCLLQVYGSSGMLLSPDLQRLCK